MGNGGKSGDNISNAYMKEISYKNFATADSDEDGLTNVCELEIGSDYDNPDTDGDGLYDGYEYSELETSLILQDTDGNAITDDKEDFDADGLTNMEEYNHDTDPYEADSDEDILQRVKEQITYGSEQVTEVSVSLKTNGLIDDKVTISNLYETDMLCTDVVGLVGVPVEIESDVNFDEAQITFCYDDTKLNGTSESDLGILWYDEKEDWFDLQENAVVDEANNKVTLTTTHFSKYMLVDCKKWFDEWEKEVDYRGDAGYYDIAYAIDTSRSMNTDSRLTVAKKALKSFVSEQSGKDKGCLISFGGTGNTKIISELGTSKKKLKSAVEGLVTTTKDGTDIENGVKKSIACLKKGNNNNRMLLLFSDGQIRYDEEIAESAKDAKIRIYAINVGREDKGENLEKYATYTGGEYYYCPTTDKIETESAKIKDSTVGKLDTKDSDKDGVYDVIEKQGARLSNGKLIKTDSKKKDTDGDGLSDGKEIGIMYTKKKVYTYGRDRVIRTVYARSFKFYSNPTKVDTDKDSVSDRYDPYPWHGYCGGSHPEKAYHHKSFKQVGEKENAKYVCTKKTCGYSFAAPETEDAKILTEKDLQKMKCLKSEERKSIRENIPILIVREYAREKSTR